ncbi:Dolichyl-diphosphooligosaccharide--protein glycosyltransferase subunit DAD1 [Linum perenne]
MARSTVKDTQALFQTLRSAYSATPNNLKIIDLYVAFAVFTALIQVVYMAVVGSFPFNSFLSGVLSCIGTAVLAVCLRIQVNKDNKDFKVKIHSLNCIKLYQTEKSTIHLFLLTSNSPRCRIWHRRELSPISFSATWCFTW